MHQERQRAEGLVNYHHLSTGLEPTLIENIDFSSSSKKPQIIINTPVVSPDEKTIAVLAAYFNFPILEQILRDRTGWGNSSQVYLLDRFGKNNLLSPEDKAAWPKFSEGKNQPKIYFNSNNIPVIGASYWLEPLNSTLLLEIPLREALLPVRQLTGNIYFICLFCLVLVTGVFSWLFRQIIDSFGEIKNAAWEFSQGNRNAFTAMNTQGEMGIIAQTFQELTTEIRSLYEDFQEQVTQLELAEISAIQSYQELQLEKEKVETISKQLSVANQSITLLNQSLQSKNLDLTSELKLINQRLNQFFDAIPVGIIVLDAQGVQYHTNQRAKELLQGATQNHNSDYFYLFNLKRPCPENQKPGYQALKDGKFFYRDNLAIHYPNKMIPIETWETPIFDRGGKITYAIIAFQDISGRLKTEVEKIKFTQKLLQLNQANERFVPRQFLQILNKKSILDVKLGDNFQEKMSVLFSDIRSFTTLSEKMTPEDNFRFINAYLSRMEPAISANKGFIDKYIGDAIMALFNGSADDAIRAGITMLNELNLYNQTRQRPGRPPFKIGIGINTGLVMLGTVGGQNRMEGTVISDAVNLAARLERLTKTYGVSLLISHHTFLCLENASKYALRLIDKVVVEGKSEPVSVYEIFDADLPAIKEAKLKTKTTFEQGLLHYNLGDFPTAQNIFLSCLQQNPQDTVSQIYLKFCQDKHCQV